MSKNNLSKKMAYCAICLALAAVTSLITPYRFPFGGAVTLCSMLFVVLPAWLYGVKTGAVCGLAYGLIQFALSPYVISVPQFFLDYVLAFSVMCVAGIFSEKKNGLIKGYLAAVVARWVIATLAGLAWIAAGFTAWDQWDPLPYSMAYNGAYIFTEAAVTVIILCIPAMKNALMHVKTLSR